MIEQFTRTEREQLWKELNEWHEAEKTKEDDKKVFEFKKKCAYYFDKYPEIGYISFSQAHTYDGDGASVYDRICVLDEDGDEIDSYGCSWVKTLIKGFENVPMPEKYCYDGNDVLGWEGENHSYKVVTRTLDLDELEG